VLLLLEHALDTHSSTGDAIQRIENEMVGGVDRDAKPSQSDRVELLLEQGLGRAADDVDEEVRRFANGVNGRRNAFANRLPADPLRSNRYTEYCVRRGWSSRSVAQSRKGFKCRSND
jgi:hypothetical protein